MIPCHVLELLYAGAEPASFRRIKPKLKQHSICRLTANQYIRDLVPSRGRCFSYDGLSQHYVDVRPISTYCNLHCDQNRQLPIEDTFPFGAVQYVTRQVNALGGRT